MFGHFGLNSEIIIKKKIGVKQLIAMIIGVYGTRKQRKSENFRFSKMTI